MLPPVDQHQEQHEAEQERQHARHGDHGLLPTGRPAVVQAEVQVQLGALHQDTRVDGAVQTLCGGSVGGSRTRQS